MFDLYHGEQVGEGNKSLALRLEFRAPDRTLTDEEVAERRAAIEQRARVDRGAAPCLMASPWSGAAGYGGAVAAAILRRHPSLELTAVTARSDAGRRHDELYPRYRVPMELEAFDPDRDRRARAGRRSSPIRTARPRPPSRRCASAA